VCASLKKELIQEQACFMTEKEYINLFEKYQLGICTPGEIELLKNYLDRFQLLDLPWEDEMGDKATINKTIYAEIEKDIRRTQKPIVTGIWKKYRIAMAAAAILIFISAGSYLFIFNKQKLQPSINSTAKQNSNNEIIPGSNKAVLTLANGATIILDSAKNGVIAQDGNTKISKLTNGQLIYNTPANTGTVITYNMLSTPRGGQYKLTLPDGSQIWLNAASSIRYPTVFNGKERNVEITGEAYFEVTKNPAQPFKVTVNSMQAEVLGTHFNINAYTDEPAIKTTLLEGSIKISRGNMNNILKPGQQAQVNDNSGLKILSNVNTDDVIAWKNGFISFKSSDLKTIMRQISRWYDVDVVYEGNIAERNFTGEISRSSDLSELLKILQASNIHFKIEQRTITVVP
jgi:transmembrane sensor